LALVACRAKKMSATDTSAMSFGHIPHAAHAQGFDNVVEFKASLAKEKSFWAISSLTPCT